MGVYLDWRTSDVIGSTIHDGFIHHDHPLSPGSQLSLQKEVENETDCKIDTLEDFKLSSKKGILKCPRISSHRHLSQE